METSSPRKAKKINGFFSGSRNKDNPYSKRGLDKFSALLTDLEAKKQQIYSQRGSEDISLVRFVYKDMDNCVPIVVKKKKEKNKSGGDNNATPLQHESETPLDDKFLVDQSKDEGKLSRSVSDNKLVTKKKSFSWNEIKLNHWRRPSYYLPAAVILILLFFCSLGDHLQYFAPLLDGT